MWFCCIVIAEPGASRDVHSQLHARSGRTIKKAAQEPLIPSANTALFEICYERVAHRLRNRVNRRFVARMIHADGQTDPVLERRFHFFG